MERGIVLSPQFSFLPTGEVFFKSAVDEMELRKYLLYWDKINVPKSSFLDFDCHQFRFLQKAGVLERTPYGQEYNMYALGMNNSRNLMMRNIGLGQGVGLARIDDCTNIHLDRYAGDEILRAHEDVYMLLESKNKGCWSKGQVASELMSFDAEDKQSLEFNLYNLLPVPSVDTPLGDILEFKTRRYDELLAFRIYLDELYQSIISSADIPRAYNTEMTKLELSLRDLNRTMKESKIQIVIDSLRSVMGGMGEILGLSLGAIGAASTFGVTPLIAGLSGAGIGIAAKVIPQSKNSIPKELTYIKSIKKDLSAYK
ncbi:DUF6236 family protein [Photobacterium leiognathi]|uniref:DUF6236 family protein n=1 Tax=Photobacterium leiognathi TaxID=553611 RepID=UPI00298124C1|nr:DUF6236 family protein [Photobacterium leiognathi]